MHAVFATKKQRSCMWRRRGENCAQYSATRRSGNGIRPAKEKEEQPPLPPDARVSAASRLFLAFQIDVPYN